MPVSSALTPPPPPKKTGIADPIMNKHQPHRAHPHTEKKKKEKRRTPATTPKKKMKMAPTLGILADPALSFLFLFEIV
jgi:hypothetical protein